MPLTSDQQKLGRPTKKISAWIRIAGPSLCQLGKDMQVEESIPMSLLIGMIHSIETALRATIFGQRWFLNITGTSLTQTEVRRLPTPSNVAGESPGSRNFFGRGEQVFVDQSFRVSADLFRGDASFQPVEFRVRFTPEMI